MNFTEKWLGRLSFSFLILAAVLIWEAYQASTGRRGTVAGWQIGLYLVAALMGMILGGLGIRIRHRK